MQFVDLKFIQIFATSCFNKICYGFKLYVIDTHFKVLGICLTEIKRMLLFSQRNIKNIQQFVQLTHAERRHILRNLSDEQYEDVMNVIGKMPHIDFQVRSEGEQQQMYL
jgi:preprotein translocase subunit Sec63